MTMWKRKWWQWTYRVTLPFLYGRQTSVLVTKELGFISYHLIRVVHGPKKLDDIALEHPRTLP